jgi:hypothetical protein
MKIGGLPVERKHSTVHVECIISDIVTRQRCGEYVYNRWVCCGESVYEFTHFLLNLVFPPVIRISAAKFTGKHLLKTQPERQAVNFSTDSQ